MGHCSKMNDVCLLKTEREPRDDDVAQMECGRYPKYYC